METETNKTSDAIKLLKGELAQRKERNSGYSLRAFAQNLGMSPAQLSQLMSGKRNFTVDVLNQISKSLHLSPDEERSLLTKTLLDRSTTQTADIKKRALQEDEFRLISDWYHFAILSLGKVRGAKADPFWISDRLGITPAEAKEALARLRRLEILEEGTSLKQKSAPLNVISETPSRAIQAYHWQILNLAQEKLVSAPLDKRDYSAITFPADPTKIVEARKMVETFQDRLAEFLFTPNTKEVFVFACQLFSLERNK